jgi:hypothetical protein
MVPQGTQGTLNPLNGVFAVRVVIFLQACRATVLLARVAHNWMSAIFVILMLAFPRITAVFENLGSLKFHIFTHTINTLSHLLQFLWKRFWPWTIKNFSGLQFGDRLFWQQCQLLPGFFQNCLGCFTLVFGHRQAEAAQFLHTISHVFVVLTFVADSMLLL